MNQQPVDAARHIATLKRRAAYLTSKRPYCSWDLAERAALRWALSVIEKGPGDLR